MQTCKVNMHSLHIKLSRRESQTPTTSTYEFALRWRSSLSTLTTCWRRIAIGKEFTHIQSIV